MAVFDITRLLARLALAAGLVAIGLLVAGPLGWRFGWWHYSVGFQRLLPWAAYTGLGAIVLATLALLTGLMRIGRLSHRAAFACLAAIAMGFTGLWLPHSWNQMRGVFPPINDVTTDTARPPELKVAATLRKASGMNDTRYGGETTAAHQRKAYPDIAPLILNLPPEQAFVLALAAAETMSRWTVVSRDERARVIEATASSRWFGFVDDVAVRITAEGGGSRVDVRSQSRIGRSDFGANAARVRAYLATLKARAGI